jgi:hypothetical protein
MSLDLRIPMGLMFSLLGVILTGFGLATNGSLIYNASLGINVNKWWGLVLLAFGITMYILGRRGQKRACQPASRARRQYPLAPRPLKTNSPGMGRFIYAP